jgi:iron-sulfur cluster repair protein YtfE (RIC family)
MAAHFDRASPLDAVVASHHDYVWARLPYLVPMAAKIARRCRRGGGGCAALAGLVADLRSVLLDHLDHEERLLATLAGAADARFVKERIADLHAEHLAVSELFARIRAVGLVDHHADDEVCGAERALHRELTLLDRHVRAQIVLEESLLAVRFADAHP